MLKVIQAEELEKYRDLCDWVIDARSPSEYAIDHIPGSINCPVLDDAQRHEVGTLYKQNAFSARRMGAYYTLGAIRQFLQLPMVLTAPKSARFLVYCARGGMRSRSLATILSEIGFGVFQLDRGYKSYRAQLAQLFERTLAQPVFVLHGYTGSLKTQVLNQLQGHVNTIDLEGMARHRGSLLGFLPGQNQPQQKQFESRLGEVLRRMDPDKPILVEGESRGIGNCQLPGPFWRQMQAGTHLWLEVSQEERVHNILNHYRQLIGDPQLLAAVQKLKRYLSAQNFSALINALHQGDWSRFTELLLTHHYDPLYGKAKQRAVLLEPLAGEDHAQTVLRVVREMSGHEG